ncbi:hypothetical protein JCM8097_006117 [Rhodosporidiobolus ruineniae]
MSFAEPPKKKRKLPDLDASFDDPLRPSDNPFLHQGRKRQVAHEKGQWAAHVYVELEPSPGFRKALKEAVQLASSSFSGSRSPPLAPDSDSSTPPEPVIYSLLTPSAPSSIPIPGSSTPTSRSSTPTADLCSTLSQPSSSGADSRLHLSLSRPLMLQTNQRADLRTAVRRVAGSVEGFSARYASFGVLENDEQTRRFLGIEIGPGYSSLLALSRKLDDELDKLRLPVYYPEPRFHTSLCWSSVTSASLASPPPPADAVEGDEPPSRPPLPFDDSTLSSLDAALGKRLRSEELWVGELCVKIGKDVARYALSGSESG